MHLSYLVALELSGGAFELSGRTAKALASCQLETARAASYRGEQPEHLRLGTQTLCVFGPCVVHLSYRGRQPKQLHLATERIQKVRLSWGTSNDSVAACACADAPESPDGSRADKSGIEHHNHKKTLCLCGRASYARWLAGLKARKRVPQRPEIHPRAVANGQRGPIRIPQLWTRGTKITSTRSLWARRGHLPTLPRWWDNRVPPSDPTVAKGLVASKFKALSVGATRKSPPSFEKLSEMTSPPVQPPVQLPAMGGGELNSVEGGSSSGGGSKLELGGGT